MKNLDFILKLYGNKYYFAPITLTIIAVTIISSRYSANANFDLVSSMFGDMFLGSILLFSLLLQKFLDGKKEVINALTMAFISSILAMFALFFFKTHSFFYNFAMVVAIAAIFAFFAIFKEIANALGYK